MQQTFSCPKCGWQVAFGTQFCSHCSNSLSWQQQTTPPIYQQPFNYQQQPDYSQQLHYKMNWFQNHLNWTYLLTWLLVPILLALLYMIVSIAIGAPLPFILSFPVIFSIILLVDLSVGGWVIKQKGRSLWWLLLFGWFSPLWLDNKNS